LSHILIRVTDIDRSVAFYRDVLGLRLHKDARDVEPGKARAVIGVVGDIAIEMIEVQPTDAEPAPRRGRDAPGYATLAFTVADVAAALEVLKSHGLTRFPEVVTTEAGFKVMLFRDPDGNVLELIEFAGARSLFDVATKAAAH
jgi:catechol 2,3-dioxygenase-like lactoylglutathione lyase family enzyme